MEAVAPDPLLVERVRKRKGLLHLWRCPVEGGVKACHLRQSGIEGQRHSNGREIVRLVERSERHQCFHFREQFWCDPRWLGMTHTAVNHGWPSAASFRPPSRSLAHGSSAGKTSLGVVDRVAPR